MDGTQSLGTSKSFLDHIRRLTWVVAQQEAVTTVSWPGHPPKCLLVGHGSGRAATLLRSPHAVRIALLKRH